MKRPPFAAILGLFCASLCLGGNIQAWKINYGGFEARFGEAQITNPFPDQAHPKTTFQSSGTPNEVRQNSRGLQITALRFTGAITRLAATQSKKPSMNIDRLVAEDRVIIRYDSDIARSYQLNGGHQPTEAAGTLSVLTSESALLNESNDEDKITFNNPFVVNDHRSGKNSEGPTQTVSKITAVSGVFHYQPSEKGERAKLKSADVKGQVHFHQIKTIIDPNSHKPVVTEYDLVGDHLTEEMSGEEGTVVLEGNVVGSVVGEDGGDFNCSKVVATTDEEGNITHIEELNFHGSDVPHSKEKQP